MTLPKLNIPKYTTTIPSTDKTVEFRPYTVAEEKVLLLTLETGNKDSMVRAIGDILEACTFGKIDVSSLTSYDLEYLFIQLRIKSVGESSSISISCPECENPVRTEVELDRAFVEESGSKVANIDLDGIIGIRVVHPAFGSITRYSDLSDEESAILSSIEVIYDKDNVYPIAEVEISELREFISSFTTSQRNKVLEHIANQPSVVLEHEYTCMKCEKTHTKTLRGISNFFT